MEYDYKEYRKDSQSALKDRKVTKEEPLSHYEAKEETRKNHEEPKEKLLMKNAYGALNLGVSDKKQETGQRKEDRLITVSGLKEGRHTESRDFGQVRETGSVKLGRLQKRAFTNAHEKETSAMAFRALKEHTGDKIVNHLQELAEKENLQVLQQMLPFLVEKEEKASMELLREQRQQDGGLEKDKARYLETLEQNQIHRQQRKRDLVQRINQTVDQEKMKEHASQKGKKHRDMVSLLWNSLEQQDEAEQEDEESDKSED